MTSRLRSWLEALGDLFWLRPALLVLGGVVLGETMVWAERAGVAEGLSGSGWVYAGGETGARALLSATASSTIGVAGTVFSITVAALSLASGQMGPRLLRNFTRDAGNQYTLGIFLGTFAYALVLLRTVRSVEEVAFVPHLGVTGGLMLALLCVGTLVWFVHHVASSINVETVIDVVHAELSRAIGRLDETTPDARCAATAPGGAPLRQPAQGYLRSVDEDGLADWAAARGATLVLLVRPGDYLFPGAPAALLAGSGDADEAAEVLRDALSLGPRQAAVQDPEFAVRQLVEIAVRALSPGINDPFTAVAVLDRLGAALCEIAPRQLPGPAVLRDGRIVLHRRVTDYDGLCDAMFHMIRQNAGASVAVPVRMLEVIGRVLEVERQPRRRDALFRHADLVLGAGQSAIKAGRDLADLRDRHAALRRASPTLPRPGC